MLAVERDRRRAITRWRGVDDLEPGHGRASPAPRGCTGESLRRTAKRRSTSA
jgi:hypothetical protein